MDLIKVSLVTLNNATLIMFTYPTLDYDYRLRIRLQAQNGQTQLSSETLQSILDLRNEGYSMQKIAKKLKISYYAV
jgi:DNA-binding NarL/FixJ family response regulator